MNKLQSDIGDIFSGPSTSGTPTSEEKSIDENKLKKFDSIIGNTNIPGGYTKLANYDDYSKIKDALNKIKNSGPNTIFSVTATYYEYTQFKRAIFKCTKCEYDQDTGRIVKMEFEATGKFN